MTNTKKGKILTFPPPQLDEETVRRIGSKLREQYDEVLSEPVPDRFTELLNQLEQSEKSGGADTHDK